MKRKLTSHGAEQEPSVITIPAGADTGLDAPIRCGGRELMMIAGPCAVEGREMLLEVAHAVRDAGAVLLRGGAFKPRTSPYAFQGLGAEALEYLSEARSATGLGIVTEVLDPRDVELVARHADVLQIGSRNMQNHALLAEAGRSRRPILLKRGYAATIEEFLQAAEHVMANGNGKVILCERGIRTFETRTRNTLDLSAVPVLRSETHLPVIVDPSHGGGRADLVAALSFGAIAVGADGLMIEVHPDPRHARSDGDQSITPRAFGDLMLRLTGFATAAERILWASSPLQRVASAGSGAAANGDGTSSGVPSELVTVRAEIEALDREIVALVGRRVRAAREAGRVKRVSGLPIIDQLQEHEVVRRVRELAATSELPFPELRELQQYLIAISRRAQAEDLNS